MKLRPSIEIETFLAEAEAEAQRWRELSCFRHSNLYGIGNLDEPVSFFAVRFEPVTCQTGAGSADAYSVVCEPVAPVFTVTGEPLPARNHRAGTEDASAEPYSNLTVGSLLPTVLLVCLTHRDYLSRAGVMLCIGRRGDRYTVALAAIG